MNDAENTAPRADEPRHAPGEAGFYSLFESTGAVMLIIDPDDGRIVAANPAAARYYGWPVEHLCTMRIRDINTLDPDSVQAEMERARREEQGRFLFSHRRADGSVRDVEVYSGRILVEGRELLHSIIHDVTDRRRAEETLRLTQYSVDHSGEALYWMGPDARFVYVNEAACRALEYTREELLTMTVHDIGPEFPAEVWPAHWAELRERKSMRIETIHRTRSGRVFPVEISLNHMEFEGREYNVALARDITERKRAEEQRLKLERDLQYARRKESLDILAGGIAHDFNNLLLGVLGNAELLLEDLPQGTPAHDSTREIVIAARRAAALSRQMLAFSGRARLDMGIVDLTEVVQGMMDLAATVVSKRASLKYDLRGDLPGVHADPDRLRQVALSLVTNASEALGDEHGVIGIRTGVMECCGCDEPAYVGGHCPEGTHVYLEVSDTGCGMSPETVTRMFDPFFSEKFVGRGLGLAAVLGIVRGHNGAIKVTSELGSGTTITLQFPVASGS